jgi:ribosomal protein S18 acetylase RimI-like enzyme
MRIEFRKARIPAEIKALVRFDKRVFGADCFADEMWASCEAWWMTLGGRRIGCCAFEMDADFEGDERKGGPRRRVGSLYIASTGIVAEFRGCGLGKVMKAWQVAYARRLGYRRIVTNSRKSNEAMIALNRQFGFRKVRTVAGYYDEPKEGAVVMELVIGG